MIEHLRVHIKARAGLIYLSSFEEERVEQALNTICKQLNHGLYVWDLHRGFEEILKDAVDTPEPDKAKHPSQCLEEIQKYKGDAVFVLKDFQKFFYPEDSGGGVATTRALRTLSSAVC